MPERPSPERTAAILEQLRVIILLGRVHAIAAATANNPDEFQRTKAITTIKDEFNDGYAALDELVAALAAETARADRYARLAGYTHGEMLAENDALAARLEQAREALQQIANPSVPKRSDTGDWRLPAEIALAALAALQEAPPNEPPKYSEGDRCRICLHWFWNDGGWHSLVPTTYAGIEDEARGVYCPTHYRYEQDAERRGVPSRGEPTAP